MSTSSRSPNAWQSVLKTGFDIIAPATQAKPKRNSPKVLTEAPAGPAMPDTIKSPYSAIDVARAWRQSKGVVAQASTTSAAGVAGLIVKVIQYVQANPNKDVNIVFADDSYVYGLFLEYDQAKGFEWSFATYDEEPGWHEFPDNNFLSGKVSDPAKFASVLFTKVLPQWESLADAAEPDPSQGNDPW